MQIISLSLLFIRIAISSSFLARGTQKFKMWKTSPSEQMPKKMLNIMKILSIVEPLGAVALMTGFLTQIAALGLAVIIIGAIYFKIKIWKKKFTEPGGWELDLIILSGLLLLLIVGAGSYALDNFF